MAKADVLEFRASSHPIFALTKYIVNFFLPFLSFNLYAMTWYPSRNQQWNIFLFHQVLLFSGQHFGKPLHLKKKKI